MSKEEQKPNIYQIPKNSFDTGYVLNGQFKTRRYHPGTTVLGNFHLWMA